MLTLVPPQFFGQHHDKEIFLGSSSIKTFKNSLNVFKIQVGHGLAPLVFASVINSSTCFKIKMKFIALEKRLNYYWQTCLWCTFSHLHFFSPFEAITSLGVVTFGMLTWAYCAFVNHKIIPQTFHQLHHSSNLTNFKHIAPLDN